MSIASKVKSLAIDLCPPLLLRAWRSKRGAEQPDGAMDRFYRGLIPDGALVFDIGANVGVRTRSFVRLGFRVVAVEPQRQCHEMLRSEFGGEPRVTLVNKAVGQTPGVAIMKVSSLTGLSTLSPEFIETTTKSSRFKGIEWERSEQVEVITLDQLIEEHGSPDFVKIDVEGFEPQVLAGLSRSLKLLSLEWTPELTDNLLRSIARLRELGDYEFNLTWAESMRMARSRWMDYQKLVEMVRFFSEDTYLWADVFARKKP